MIAALRRLALPIAVTSLAVNLIMLVVSCVLWWLAAANGWVESVTFVSHVSMLALVFSATSGIAAGLAGILALIPIDDGKPGDSWNGEMPADPLRDTTMDPPAPLTAELAAQPPAPTFVDPDEWGKGRYL